jgi:hypothetical protein
LVPTASAAYNRFLWKQIFAQKYEQLKIVKYSEKNIVFVCGILKGFLASLYFVVKLIICANKSC